MPWIAPEVIGTTIVHQYTNEHDPWISCKHDPRHIDIHRMPSGHPEIPWVAIERGRCRYCEALIFRFFLTPYADYYEGIKAWEAQAFTPHDAG